MVKIIKQENTFIFEIKGSHKLWALKSSITIPEEHILKYEKYDGSYNLGIRFPGTELPGVIKAGSFYSGTDSIFCDVSNKEKAIIIYLKDEHYKKLIIEVEDVKEAIELLSQ